MKILFAVMACDVRESFVSTPETRAEGEERLKEALDVCYDKVIERYDGSPYVNMGFDGCDESYYEAYYQLPLLSTREKCLAYLDRVWGRFGYSDGEITNTNTAIAEEMARQRDICLAAPTALSRSES